MSVTGTFTVSTSDDTRFKAGDSIQLTLDSSVDLAVVENVTASAPAVPAPAPSTTPAAPANAGAAT